MGAGSSQEAAYTLKASVPAGAYHCVLDGIVIRPVEVTFDLIWRRGGTDTTLASWQSACASVACSSSHSTTRLWDRVTCG